MILVWHGFSFTQGQKCSAVIVFYYFFAPCQNMYIYHVSVSQSIFYETFFSFIRSLLDIVCVLRTEADRLEELSIPDRCTAIGQDISPTEHDLND